MNTQENNNITSIKESHFSSDVKRVGGTIFYIDDTADGKYEFFDADGNVIEAVHVGDKPYAYRVVTSGSKDKYYIYHDEVYTYKRWTYCEDEDYTFEFLDTLETVGSGKTNTEKIMVENDGIYVSKDSGGLPTIWYQLQQARLTKVGGCDDWFIPSRDEIEELRKAVESGNITGGTIAGSSYDESIFTYKWIWSSSEHSSQRVRVWLYLNQYWGLSSKDGYLSVFFTRAF